MEQNKDWLRNIVLGNKPTSNAQTIGNIIGGALFGGGLLATSNAPNESYKTAAKSAIAQGEGVLPAFEGRSTQMKQSLDADLAGYEQSAVKQAETGLQARGITDKGVARETGANVKAGLSGAYAQARAALSRAKLQAGSQLENAVSNYKMNIADKQYQSLLNNYASKMGIWQALGGAGASILQKNEPIKPLRKDIDPKGSSDSKPERTKADAKFRNIPVVEKVEPFRQVDFNPFGKFQPKQGGR
jgi:hypothetical protein